MGCEGIDPGATGITEAKELGHLVEGFACGVIYGVTYIAVMPGVSLAAGEVEMGVAAGDYQG